MDCDFKIEYSTENEDSNESNPVLSIAMDTSEQATSDIKSEINPWASKDLKEFLFYNCPECEYRASFEPDFYDHALSTHPNAKDVYEASNEVEIYVRQKEKVKQVLEEPEYCDTFLEDYDHPCRSISNTNWYVYPDQPPNSVHTLTNDPTIISNSYRIDPNTASK